MPGMGPGTMIMIYMMNMLTSSDELVRSSLTIYKVSLCLSSNKVTCMSVQDPKTPRTVSMQYLRLEQKQSPLHVASGELTGF